MTFAGNSFNDFLKIDLPHFVQFKQHQGKITTCHRKKITSPNFYQQAPASMQ